jgi:hypothetical protein
LRWVKGIASIPVWADALAAPSERIAQSGKSVYTRMRRAETGHADFLALSEMGMLNAPWLGRVALIRGLTMGERSRTAIHEWSIS